MFMPCLIWEHGHRVDAARGSILLKGSILSVVAAITLSIAASGTKMFCTARQGFSGERKGHLNWLIGPGEEIILPLGRKHSTSHFCA